MNPGFDKVWKLAAKRYRMIAQQNAKLAATMVIRGASPDYIPKEVRDHIAELERRIAEYEADDDHEDYGDWQEPILIAPGGEILSPEGATTIAEAIEMLEEKE